MWLTTTYEFSTYLVVTLLAGWNGKARNTFIHRRRQLLHAGCLVCDVIITASNYHRRRSSVSLSLAGTKCLLAANYKTFP